VSAVVELREVEKYYRGARTAVHALQAVDLVVEPGEAHANGHRDTPPGGRPARQATRRPVPGASRRAVMRVHAEAGEGELRHVGAAEDDEAGADQPLHGGRGGSGRLRAVQHHRAGAGGDAGLVIQVLDADRDAGIGRGRTPRGAQRVLRRRRGAGRAGMDGGEGTRALPARFGDAGQRRLGQRGGGGAPGGQGRRGLDNGLHPRAFHQ
jgi:hypothetical protein